MTFKFSKPFVITAAATAAAAGLGGYIWHEQARPRVLEMYLFNLKGGQSAFIRTPEDKRILIDGGGNSEIVRQVSRILPFYSRRIDAVIATKAEGKNIVGLIEILGRYSIGSAYVPGLTLSSLGLSSSTDQIYETFVEKLKNEKIATHPWMAGDFIDTDLKTRIKILFPALPESFAYSRASPPEIAFKISFGSTSATFMGDLSKKSQKFIASENFGTSDVLILYHSISETNVSRELLAEVRPRYFVYSAALTSAKSKKPISKKKTESDPLAVILDDHRFNIRKTGIIKIVSDGKNIRISETF